MRGIGPIYQPGLEALALPTATHAASYRQTDGTIIDPILTRSDCCGGGGTHAYSGDNLEPSADLSGANLAIAESLDWLDRYVGPVE